jgi:hypothetical protein
MPRVAAIESVAGTIARLPQGNWTASDTTAIATRLVAWLPKGSAPPIPSLKGDPLRDEAKKPRLATWLLWSVLVVGLIFLALHHL